MTSIIVMGVSGCGKSSLGAALAQALGWPLIEGDDFHSPENVARMRAGTPLTDAHRAGWLAALGTELQRHPKGAVLTCSALKRAYRAQLRSVVPGLRFVHLELTRDEARQRVAQRAGAHYFQPGLVDSQFDTLEPPVGEAGVLSLHATQPLDALAGRVIRWHQEITA
jgi:gluconokinase